MPSVHRQENNIVHAIRGCAKSAAPDVLYAARIDVYLLTSFNGLNDELTLNEVAAKLKILVNNIGEYLKRDQKVEENIMDNKKVFVVHGHDHQLLQEVELMIRRIGLEPMEALIFNRHRGGNMVQ